MKHDPRTDPEVPPGMSIALLQDLHLLTRDGHLNADARRKLKQIRHLVGLLRPAVDDALARAAAPVIVDCGAGKSYLGALLYELVLGPAGRGQLVAIEARPELTAQAAARAARFGHARFAVAAGAIAEVALDARPSVVTALHACDTATDDAIAFGLQKHAQAMVLVPCCQAEVARTLNAGKALTLARTPLAELWRHPLHTREMGSQITNVLRCLYLEACGYQVTVTELVGWEHSLKNELIIARYTGQKKRSAAERLRAILAQFGIESLLQTRFRLPDSPG